MAVTKVALKRFPYYQTAGLAALLSVLFLLGGCQSLSTPEQVTLAFWQAMTEGDTGTAKKYATPETQYLVIQQQHLEGAALQTGVILIDGVNATVATVMTLKASENKKVLSFETVLLKENDLWKVDYQRTLNNFLNLPFGDVFKSLHAIGETLNHAIGETLNKELERQVPLFERQIKSFSNELIRQLDEFRRQLEKSIPPEKQPPQ